MPAKKASKAAKPTVADSQTATSLPVEISQAPAGMIPRKRFEEKIKTLQSLSLFKNDKGDPVAFEGKVKKDFIQACEQSYPILERTFGTIHELGSFLNEVRTRLRPHKLYYSWLEFIGMPKGTARNYVQAHERYRDELLHFAYLGLKELVIASRLPDCVEYVRQHEEDIAAQTAEELERAVKTRRKKAVPPGQKRRGRKSRCITVAGCKMWPSTDGTKLRIEGITEKQRNQIIDAVKAILSKENE